LDGFGGQIHAPAALSPGKRPGIHCTGRKAGQRTGLDGCGKSRPHQDSIPGPSSLVSRPTQNILNKKKLYFRTDIIYTLTWARRLGSEACSTCTMLISPYPLPCFHTHVNSYGVSMYVVSIKCKYLERNNDRLFYYNWYCVIYSPVSSSQRLPLVIQRSVINYCGSVR